MPRVDRTYTFTVLFQAASDVPGWVAHILEIDVVTQGDTLAQAVEMAAEAGVLFVTEEIAAGRDPLEHRAPAEFWPALWDVLGTGERIPLAQLDDDAGVKAAAAIMELAISIDDERDQKDGHCEIRALPFALHRRAA